MLHINNACIAFGAEVLFSGFNLNLEQEKPLVSWGSPVAEKLHC